MNKLAKDLLFNAVYHKALPFIAIPLELIKEYHNWVIEFEENNKE